MKKWIFLILLFPLTCIAQTYQYIGVEDGLSNRRVYYIQKDRTGYMWFLTHEGINRYNGKDFKRYKLMDGDVEVNSLLNLNWLYIDKEDVLWEIGKKGKIFRYDQIHDCFTLVYKLPIENFRDLPAPVSFAWLDQSKHIWLCNEETIFIYNTDTGEVTHIKNDISEEINDIEQIDDTHYFIGTLHHGDTFFGGGDDEVELLVLYFKVACATTVNQCLHLRAHGVEVDGGCHDDDVGGNHLFHHFGGIVLLRAGFAVHAAYAASRAVVDVLVFQENLFYLMSGLCGTAHEFIAQEVGVSIPAGTGGED